MSNMFCFVVFLGGEGFIATVFFKLALPLCGDLNVFVMQTHIKLISILCM